MEECMNFCARYITDVESKSNRPIRNDDGDDNIGRGLGRGEQFEINYLTFIQAHRYVLDRKSVV